MKRFGLFLCGMHVLHPRPLAAAATTTTPPEPSPTTTTKNPFARGCLREKVPAWTQWRVCNSDDPPQHVGILCQPSEFPQYMEVRIKCQDWESVTFSSWVVRLPPFTVLVLVVFVVCVCVC